MADICMCDDDTCRLKDTCYRYKAIPCPYRQFYFETPPRDYKEDDEEETCDYYWELTDGT